MSGGTEVLSVSGGTEVSSVSGGAEVSSVTRAVREVRGAGWWLREGSTCVSLTFDDKPTAEERGRLKVLAFNWNPVTRNWYKLRSERAWVEALTVAKTVVSWESVGEYPDDSDLSDLPGAPTHYGDRW